MENDFFDIDFKDPSMLNFMQSFEDIKEEEPTVEQEASDVSEKSEEVEANKNVKAIQNEGGEDSSKSEKSSPNISSSIALTLADNGVLETLSSERLAKIQTTEDLITAFEEELTNRLDDKQKRIDEALKYNIQPSTIQYLEQNIEFLDNITEETLNREGDEGEKFRANLIYQSFKMKGLDDDDASKMTKISIDEGDDQKDAAKALKYLKEFYANMYKKEVDKKKEEQAQIEKEQEKEAKTFADYVLKDDDFYKKLEIGETVRKKIYDTLYKRTKREDGNKYTDMEWFNKQNPQEFARFISTMFVLTDGLKNFDGLFKGPVKKQVRESTRKLEQVLNQMSPVDGSLSLKSGVTDDLDFSRLIDIDRLQNLT